METYKDHITLSPDLNEERLETLRNLFPDWFTQEGHLDINEVKKAVNPDSVDETVASVVDEVAHSTGNDEGEADEDAPRQLGMDDAAQKRLLS